MFKLLNEEGDAGEEAEAVTAVLWDINRCPVPSGCDPRWVGPCIERFLKHLGYTSRPTITAVGILTNVPDDVLRAVSSTGIILNHFPNDFSAITTQGERATKEKVQETEEVKKEKKRKKNTLVHGVLV